MKNLRLPKSTSLLLCMLLTTLIATDSLKIVGFAALAMTLVITLKKNIKAQKKTPLTIKKDLAYFYIFYLLFILTCIVSLTQDSDTGSLYVLAQYVFILCFFFLTSSTSIDCSGINPLYSFFVLACVVVLITKTGHYDQDGNYSFIYDNPNAFSTVSSMLLVPFYFMVPRSIQKKIIITIALLVIVFSKGRSALLGALLGILFAIYISKHRKTKKYSFTLLTALLFTISAFIYLTVNFYQSPLGLLLNEIMFSNTGKNLFSGREKLWEQLFQAINQSPFIGHGLSSHASQYADVTYSAHNQFIQTTLQSGVFSTIFLLLALISLALFFSRKIERATDTYLKKKYSTGLALVVMVIFQNNFEIYLLQNNMELSLLFWTLIGILASPPNTKRQQTDALQHNNSKLQ